MPPLRELWRKLTRIRQRDDLAERLREELEFHAAMKVSEAGLSRGAARRELGNPVRILEDADDVWSFPRLEHLYTDCRYAVRVLSKTPAFFCWRRWERRWASRPSRRSQRWPTRC